MQFVKGAMSFDLIRAVLVKMTVAGEKRIGLVLTKRGGTNGYSKKI